MLRFLIVAAMSYLISIARKKFETATAHYMLIPPILKKKANKLLYLMYTKRILVSTLFYHGREKKASLYTEKDGISPTMLYF